MPHTYMERAIEVGWSARLLVSPRPWVGCVVVSTEGHVFEGATQGKSGPHAEVVALEQAGEKSQGATLYVTLEPCSHHGTTPPCVEKIITSGVKKVEIAVQDPDLKVNGTGIAALREAGIEVNTGMCATQVEAQLKEYLLHRRQRRPFVTVKLAATIDGVTAMSDASSRWITGGEARADVHLLRALHDGVLVGATTARLDNPQLTVRDAKLPEGITPRQVQPQRFVLGSVPLDSHLSSTDEKTGAAPAESLTDAGGQASSGQKCLRQNDLDRNDLCQIMVELASRGSGDRHASGQVPSREPILSLLVEGGAKTVAVFHNAGLADQYVFYLAPAIAGATGNTPMFATPQASALAGTPRTMADIWRGRLVSMEQLGEDIKVVLAPKRQTA